MKRLTVTMCTVLMCSAVHRPLQACSMGHSPMGIPRPGSILVLGVVVSYMETARPIDGIALAPSLLVRPTVVISGPIAQGTVEVVPLFYHRDDDGIPRHWIAMMKRAIQTLAPKYNSDRMVEEYARKIYP